MCGTILGWENPNFSLARALLFPIFKSKKGHPLGVLFYWLITVILIQDQENVFFNTSSKILFFNLYEKTAE